MKTNLLTVKVISAILFSNLVNSSLIKGQEFCRMNNFNSINSKIENTDSNKDAYEHYLKGTQRDSEGDYKSAIREFSEAIELDRFFSEAYDKRGMEYTKLIMYKKALKDFNMSIELKANCSETYNHRGIVYYCMEEFGKAIADYNRALQLDPKYAKVYFNRGIVKLVLDDDKGAFDDIKKASDMNLKEAIDYLSKETL
jgi:tetratricopeptide (TPR) repeat protein